jgi:predicted nuclease with TOPRIM domain
MREQAQMRLEVLKKELETGRAELEKLEKQRAYLQETVLRISGAVQVLEELLAEGQGAEQEGGRPTEELQYAPSRTQTGESNIQ